MFKGFMKPADSKGFTLIELLVVISIIAMLIGILVPGMQLLKQKAGALNQKSLCRGLEISLEIFRQDYDDYPDSKVVIDVAAGSKRVTGAQHLAEAVVGRDERGFDPKSEWHSPGEPDNIYDSDMATPEGRESLARREEPYVELRRTGAYLLEQMYPAATLTEKIPDVLVNDPPVAGLTGTKRSPVLTDNFTRNTNMPIIQRSGSPILYFKAKTGSRLYKKVPLAGDNTKNWIYNWEDNKDLFNLPPLMESNEYPNHVYMGRPEGREAFYADITNNKASFDKPHNPNTFLLISAGWDGIFGTKDDVTNFDK